MRESEEVYPVSWGDRCCTAAYCAEAIAKRCPDMDADKAYIVGLLHDIGRRFGHRNEPGGPDE